MIYLRILNIVPCAIQQTLVVYQSSLRNLEFSWGGRGRQALKLIL